MPLRMRLTLLILAVSMLPFCLGSLFLYTLRISDHLGWYFMLFGTITFLLSTGLAIFIVKRFFHPIQELQKCVQLFREGLWEKHIEIKGNDEINSIGQSFNDIVGDLQSKTKELEKLNEEFHKHSVIDPLTKLLNRNGIQNELSREIARAERYGHSIFAILIDIDDFKHVNDKLGYAVGDQILCEITNKLVTNLRKEHKIGRIGGDEFLVLMPETNAYKAGLVAERLKQVISGSSVFISNQSISLHASMGICCLPSQTLCVDEVLALTHKGLLHSKRTGKNKYSFLDLNENGDLMSVEPKEYILEALMRSDNYEIFKQPIVRIDTREVTGYEFLTRFKLEELRNPLRLFQFSLENHSLTYVDHLCMKKSIDIMAELSQKCPSDFRYHVNLLPSTLITIPCESLIRNIQARVNPKSLCIEISEQQIIGDFFALKKQVDELRKAGILIAIDDVGFGRTCLENIIMLHPDIIKIDKKFVIGCSQSRAKQMFIMRVLAMLRSLDIRIIAEGIETKEDLETLETLGVPGGQGYLFGRPAPAFEGIERISEKI